MTVLVTVKVKKDLCNELGLALRKGTTVSRHCNGIKLLKDNKIDSDSAKKSFLHIANQIIGLSVEDFDEAFDLIEIK